MKDGFSILLHSICRFLVVVARYEKEQKDKGHKLNSNLKRAIKEFNEYVPRAQSSFLLFLSMVIYAVGAYLPKRSLPF